MTGRKRIAAWMLCIGLILVLSVSIAFIAHEAGHDCSGEDCPICQTIAIHVRILCALGLGVLALLPFFSLPFRQSDRYRQNQYARLFTGTPVSWKVRLND